MAKEPKKTEGVDEQAELLAIVKKLQADNEQMRTDLDVAMAKESGGERVKQLGSTTEFMPRETIDGFLQTDTPTVFFAKTHDNCGLMLVPDSKRYDETLKMEVVVPLIWVNFDPWTGPGSEMVDPKDPSGRRPKYRWGVTDIAKYADERWDVDTLVARMHLQCKRNARYFMSSEQARLDLRLEYGMIEGQRRLEERHLEAQAKLSASERAAGEPIPAAVGAE